MQIKNTPNRYGLANIFFHWATVILIAIIFPLGLIMVGLGYYDSGYQTYPPIHKSLGMILMLMTLLRVIWITFSPLPKALPQPKMMKKVAKLVHHLLYLLIGIIGLSGYLISTADGRGIDVFGWFTVPALIEPIKNQADIAGQIHLYAAWTLIGLIALHVAGALKHHFIDKDRTLLRIFGK